MIGFAGAAGLVLVVFVLVDAFETIVLPRRIARRWRVSPMLYELSWPAFRAVGRRVRNPRRRERLLSYYGPGSLLVLFACWAGLLIVGYALAIWAFASPLSGETHRSFGTAIYSAASTFFTLGFGNTAALQPRGRAIVIVTGGTGFAFLALIIAYLPTLYQAFSAREIYISQLDARGGSPPAAGELLIRHGADDLDQLEPFLADWENWSADLLEHGLSFPVLGYYRSHHDNQSWLAGLTVILDTCSLLLAGRDDGPLRQARLTYAMCRHAAVDLAQVLHARPRPDAARLDDAALDLLRRRLTEAGWEFAEPAFPHLTKLRAGYEPYVIGLSEQLLFPLPPWTAPEGAIDSWRMTQLDERGRRPVSRRSSRAARTRPR
jgi:hypothetical protein